jgi:uncharacterized membrane protein YhaH (DUF805 family)
MSWIWVFLGFGGRLDRERYQTAFRILSFACFLPALLLYGSDIRVRIAVVFLSATWPFFALAIKRLRDSGRSAGLAIALVASWLLAGACSLAGTVGAIPAGLTTLVAFGLAIALFCLFQIKIGRLPPAAED